MVSNKPTITKVNDEENRCAVCRYNLYKSQTITWKKTVYTLEDFKKQKHVVKDDGEEILTKSHKGLSCQYKFSKKDEGKYVRLYAYVGRYENLCQSEVFFVEPQHQTDIRIKHVKANDKTETEAMVGDTITCIVEYHRAQKIVAPKDVPSSTKDNVKWMTRIDEKEERLIVDDEVMRSGEISFKVPKEWKGKEVILMPYLNKHTVDIAAKITVPSEEIIIIVGTEQHSATYGNKLMFPAQAVREIKKNYPTHKHVNILIFKDAYTPMQLSIIKRDAKKWNNTVYFKQINSVDDLINYINKGDATIDRKKLKIGAIKIFAHGYPSIIDFGLDGKNANIQRFTKEHVSQLKQKSFANIPIIYSYACRTGNSDGRKVASSPKYKYDKDWITLVKPEESLAQKLSEHLNAIVYAYLRRTNYASTWNEGEDKEYKNKYMTIEDDSVSKFYNIGDLLRALKSPWDEALWNENGAYAPPTSGNSPGGELPANLYVFEKGKKPASTK